MKMLKFSASWCNPCKNLSRKMEGVEFKLPIEQIDIDSDEDELSQKYKIKTVPTLVIVDDNDNEVAKLADSTVSVEFINEWIEKHT